MFRFFKNEIAPNIQKKFYSISIKSKIHCEHITSVKDQSVKRIDSLSTTIGRKQYQQYIVPIKYIDENLSKNIIEFYCLPEMKDEIIQLMQQQNSSATLNILTPGVMRKLCPSKREFEAIAIATIPQYDFNQLKTAESILVLDNPQNEHNIGAIMRVALGSQINNLIILGKTTEDLYTKNIIQSSIGYINKLNIVPMNYNTFIKFARESNHSTYITSPFATEHCHEINFADKSIIVVGNETVGVNKSLMDLFSSHVKIPLNSEVESFNLVVATGIILYEKNRQRILANKIPTNGK